MKTKVKRAMQTLQTSYTNGLTPYPRIDNSFIFKKPYDLFPHPEMTKLNKRMKPLPFTRYRIKKETVLLFLSTTRTITPSNAEKMAEFIDDIFDDELKIKPEMENYCEDVLKIKKDFFKEFGIGKNNEINELHQSFYDEVQKQDIHLVEVDNVYFYAKQTPLLCSMQKRSKSQKKDNKQNEKKEESLVFRSQEETLEKAIDAWFEHTTNQIEQEVSQSIKIS